MIRLSGHFWIIALTISIEKLIIKISYLIFYYELTLTYVKHPLLKSKTLDDTEIRYSRRRAECETADR